MQAEQKRIDNYSNFLKEQKVQKRKATWCDFPEVDVKKKIDNDNKVEQNDKSHKKKNKNKKTFEGTQSKSSNETQEQTDDTNQTNISVKQKKKNKKNKVTVQNNEDKNHVDNSVGKVELNNMEQLQNGNLSKKTKKKKSQQSQNNNKNDETKEDQSTKTDAIQETESNKNNSQVKKKKNRNQKPTRRKDVNDRSFQLIVNGKEVELIRFDGFPIMKKDAERLTELKNNMIKKGIPKSEVQRTMKLERRRAEKALARMKREVCYNCRKGGHNLSDCPELKSKIPGVDSAEGVCFKCGSTEHRQFECKVQRDKEFRFATCFICKEAVSYFMYLKNCT